MTERTHQQCKKLLAEIINAIDEYSTEDKIDWEAAKPKILKLLEKHRPVKIQHYQYGLSRALKKNFRIIVKEEDNEELVREYGKSGIKWACTNYSHRGIRCSSTIKIKYGIVFAPITHSEKCEPKAYEFVMEVQNLLQQGKINEASKIICRNSKPTSKYINNLLLQEAEAETNDINNESDLNLYYENSSEDNTTTPFDSRSIFSPSQLSSSFDLNIPFENSASTSVKSEIDDVKSEMDEMAYRQAFEEPAVKKRRIELTLDNDKVYAFHRPSDIVLEKVCDKLQIEYCHDAYKLWGDIIFRKIPFTSKQIQLHEFKTPNIFVCFSLLFTGKTFSCYLIQHHINTAYCKELTATNTMPPSEAEKLFAETTVSDDQLKFICKFLSCNIGIYENGMLKKYGKWESESETCDLTIILAFVDGMYSIVVNL